MKTPEIKIEPDRLESLLNGRFTNMNSWFERIVNLMLTRAVAREKGDYTESDNWRGWIHVSGFEVKDIRGKFLADFTRGSYRQAFQRDIHEAVAYRFKHNENYGQLCNKKRNDKLFKLAMAGIPVKELLKQGKVNLFFWRLRSKLYVAKSEFKMRYWHRVWLKYFMTKHYLLKIWHQIGRSSHEIQLDNNSKTSYNKS